MIIKENINEVIDFARNYHKLPKQSKTIIDFLITRENETFVGSQTDLMKNCGYEVKNYIREGKHLSTNLCQFRRLGIVELSDLGLLKYKKIEGKREYEFNLVEDWINILLNM